MTEQTYEIQWRAFKFIVGYDHVLTVNMLQHHDIITLRGCDQIDLRLRNTDNRILKM